MNGNFLTKIRYRASQEAITKSTAKSPGTENFEKQGKKDYFLLTHILIPQFSGIQTHGICYNNTLGSDSRKKSEMNTLKEKTIIMQIALIDHWPGEQTVINKTR